MAYIGKEPIVGNFQKCDAITVVNGQAAYTLQVSSTNVVPESANHMLVSLNGILQAPVTSFTVSGATLTFASNLATGDVIDFVILLGNVLDLGTVSDGTITTAKIADDAVTAAKLDTGFTSYAVIEDQKTQNSHGGTFTQDAWQIRNLNTEVTDPDGIVSIGSNQFTLAAGNYLIKWFATAKDVDGHQSKLYDITGTADIEFGSSEDADDGDAVTNKSIGSTRVTPSGSNVYEIRHRCIATDSNEGFGQAQNLAVESYLLVEIYKEA